MKVVVPTAILLGAFLFATNLRAEPTKFEAFRNFLSQFSNFQDGSQISVGVLGRESGVFYLSTFSPNRMPGAFRVQDPSSNPGELANVLRRIHTDQEEGWEFTSYENWYAVEVLSEMETPETSTTPEIHRTVIRAVRAKADARFDLRVSVDQKKWYGWRRLESAKISSTPLTSTLDSIDRVRTLVPTSHDIMGLQNRQFRVDPGHENFLARGLLRWGGLGFTSFIFKHVDPGAVIIRPVDHGRQRPLIHGFLLAFNDGSYQLQLHWISRLGVRTGAYSTYFRIDDEGLKRGIFVDIVKKFEIFGGKIRLTGQISRKFACTGMVREVSAKPITWMHFPPQPPKS